MVSPRRALLKALALAPFGAIALETRAEATDYTSAADVMDAIDRLESDVAARLEAVAKAVPLAQPFARSVLADFGKHRGVRARLRRRLGVAEAPQPSTSTKDTGLEALRTAQQALVYAYAEGLPALRDAGAVDGMAGILVDVSRHLTVIDLWVESESERG